MKNKKQSHSFRHQKIFYDGNPNTEQIFKDEIDAITGLSGKKRMKEAMWQEIQFNWMNWITNLVIFSDPEIEKLKPKIGFHLFYTGIGCVSKINDEFCVSGVKDLTSNWDGMPKEGKAEIETRGGKKSLSIKSGVNGAFFQWHYWKLPFINNLKDLYEPLFDAYLLAPKELKNSITKMILFFNSEQLQSDAELLKMKNLFNDTDGLVKIINGKPIQYQSLQTRSLSVEIWENINNVKKFIYSLKGRPYNSVEKKERTNTTEVGINTIDFDILQKGYKMYFDYFCDELSKWLGKKITCELVYEKSMNDAKKSSDLQKGKNDNENEK